MHAHWEHYEHAADIGVRGFGPTLACAFEQAALALTAVLTDPMTVEARDEVRTECAAPDAELLFADWLNALISQMGTRKMLFSRFEVTIDAGRLAARAWGEPASQARHQPAVEVKGATFTTLRVAPTRDGGWMAQTVVDV